MTRIAVVIAFAASVLGAPAAFAETAVPDTENGRYSFHQVAEGLLRLDSRTGQVSLCGKKAVGWSCQTVPDERAALENEITRLQGETAALKKEMIARGIALPNGMRSPERAGEKSDELVLKLPSDADMDRVMSFLEKVWRRFIDMVQSMQKEIEKKS